MAIMKVETDIIVSIAANLIVMVIMYVETFKTDVVFISDVKHIMTLLIFFPGILPYFIL